MRIRQIGHAQPACGVDPVHSYHAGVWHHLDVDWLHRHQRPPPTHIEEVRGVLNSAKQMLDDRIEAAEVGCLRWVVRLALRRMTRRLRA